MKDGKVQVINPACMNEYKELVINNFGRSTFGYRIIFLSIDANTFGYNLYNVA